MTFDNEVALVTGASRGIGKEIALNLGNAGAIVVGSATTEDSASNITQYLHQNKIRGLGIVLEVTEQSSIDNAISNIQNEFGSPTILVNSAGITKDNLLMRMKDEEWEAVLNTNLSSIYRLCKACLRGMTKAKKGRIINISSVVGAAGNAGQTNYAAAKAGMLGFTKSLARELGSRGITVNAVAPGFIDTDMTRKLSDNQKEAILKDIPLQRLGQPHEIAAAVTFLASAEAAYITGETLHVNGGMYMT